jgi:hypothetical protein
VIETATTNITIRNKILLSILMKKNLLAQEYFSDLMLLDVLSSSYFQMRVPWLFETNINQLRVSVHD